MYIDNENFDGWEWLSKKLSEIGQDLKLYQYRQGIDETG